MLLAQCLAGNCTDGQGTYQFLDGTRYSGNWYEGRIDGAGSLTMPGGYDVVGYFRDGVPLGNGIIFTCHGTQVFYSTGKDGIITGKEEIARPAQQGIRRGTYERNGRYRGWLNGTKTRGYVPQWRGVMKWDNGAVYCGSWKDGRMDGRGHMAWKHGDEYAGQWEKGFRHGYGTYRWNDGRWYTGQWKKNIRHGLGVYEDGKGTRLEGRWHEGVFQNGVVLTPEETELLRRTPGISLEEGIRNDISD